MSEKTDFKPLPGIGRLDPELLNAVAERLREQPPAYQPAGRHSNADGSPAYVNRLFLETSPYLLQHAHNPVNWRPWGDAAFQAARDLKRPVLLSVGYSTCHWCHVMEEESFEDLEIAGYLNTHYIPIKVDREERPDIDAIYMSAVQALSGRGGWPMTVWLTPDGSPFYAGTYFPARDGDRGAPTGFLTVLKKIRQTFDTQPRVVRDAGSRLSTAVHDMLKPAPAADRLPAPSLIDGAVERFRRRFDRSYGGLAGAPKFPSSLPIRLLLRHYHRSGDAEALQMALLTLEKMAGGGMYDHVGGGFHRYAVDEKWNVPHFEKMLYDNALLATDYLAAFQATRDGRWRDIAVDVLNYVKRDMCSNEGGFFSATDADSPTPDGRRREGWYFTWQLDEIKDALGNDLFAQVKSYFDLAGAPHFEGRYIPNTPVPLSDAAQTAGSGESSLRRAVDEARQRLQQARRQRPMPMRDEKILTAWNGLMISAFAQAGFVLNDDRCTHIAADAAGFVLRHLYDGRRLFRSFKDGRARQPAFLEDYAFFIAGLLDLYQSSWDIVWLEKAVVLEQKLASRFEDDSGGFFATGRDQEKLLAREKPFYDGAVPSGNACALMNLLRLNAYTTHAAYLERLEKALRRFSGSLNANPCAMSEMLLALDAFHHPPKEVVILLPEDKQYGADRFLDRIRDQYLPDKVLAVTRQGPQQAAVCGHLPIAAHKKAVNNRPTAYVCRQGACLEPTTDPDTFVRQLV